MRACPIAVASAYWRERGPRALECLSVMCQKGLPFCRAVPLRTRKPSALQQGTLPHLQASSRILDVYERQRNRTVRSTLSTSGFLHRGQSATSPRRGSDNTARGASSAFLQRSCCLHKSLTASWRCPRSTPHPRTCLAARRPPHPQNTCRPG